MTVLLNTWVNFDGWLLIIMNLAVQLLLRQNSGNCEGVFFRLCQRRRLKESSCGIHAG